MFVRPIHVAKNGKRHAYWALVESYRTDRGPRQRVVAYLGQRDEAGRLGVHAAAESATVQQQRSGWQVLIFLITGILPLPRRTSSTYHQSLTRALRQHSMGAHGGARRQAAAPRPATNANGDKNCVRGTPRTARA
jgi:hypothetical protein